VCNARAGDSSVYLMLIFQKAKSAVMDRQTMGFENKIFQLVMVTLAG
jgi:hypothetical protein